MSERSDSTNLAEKTTPGMVNAAPRSGGACATLALVYNGAAIRLRGEMVNLTDMWKSAGSDPAKRPSEWLRHDATVEFVECVAAAHNVGVAHIMRGTRGKGGATFAHWQVALAYAKYLSPEFHMWANSVIRERMEGRSSGHLPSEAAEMLRRVDGIVRMLAHKVTEIERSMPAIHGQALENRVLADRRHVAVEYRPVLEVLIENGAHQQGRRGLSRQCRRRLERFCADRDLPVRFSRETRRPLFPVDAVRAWMDQEGRALIADHNSRIQGQGILHFPKRPTSAAPELAP